MKPQRLLLLASIFVVSSPFAHATNAVTDPVGYQATSIPIGFTALANPLVNADVVRTSASANTTSVVTLSSISNAGSLLTAGDPYYLEVVSGASEGDRFDLDTAATIAAANDTVVVNTASANNTASLSANSLNGSTVAVRKHVTLDQLQSYFSPALIGNNNPVNADQIQTFNPGTGAFTTYFLRGNGTEWRASGSTNNASKVAIAPGVGFLVRKLTSPSTFTSVGTVRMNDFSFPMPQGSTFRAPGFPVSYSPASLGGNVSNGWIGNNNPANADQLQVFNPVTGAFTVYSLRGNGTEWRAVGSTNNVTASQLFADNAPFMVLKRQADTNYFLINPVVQ
jgi:hypothetical protein